MSTDILDAIEEFESKGGALVCEGESISVTYPPDRKHELEPILATLRATRQRVAGLVRELRQGVAAAPQCPPLPAGVKLVRYEPKKAPVAVAPVTIVIDVRKFIETHLAELDARLHHPVQIRAGGSVQEILAKLAEVGLELELRIKPTQQETKGKGAHE